MNELCGKCKKKAKDPFIKCAGMCNGIYHIKCIDMQSNEYEAIQNCKGLKWFCNTCLEMLKFLWDLKSDIIDVQKQLSSEITEIRSAIKNLHNTGKEVENVGDTKSYAKAASEVVIIKPKITGQDSKKTLEMVQKHVNPTSLEVGISEVKTIKEGGVVIKCNTKEELNKVKIAAEKKLGKTYNVNTPDLKNPQIKIVDIDREMNAEDLLDTMKKQCISKQ